MKNSFRIKHGNTAPVFVNGKTSLQPYELGYCDSDEELYLGIPKLDDTIDFKKVGGVVEVGGRNLLLDSQFRKTNNVTGVVVERETGEGVLAFTGGLGVTREVFLDIPTYNFPLLQNKKISLSMFGIAINVVKGATNPFIGATLQVGYVGGTFSYFDVGWDELIPDIKWKKMGKSFQILDKTILSMRLRFIGQDFTGTIKIKMPKLEVGNSLTDWSPAPEDIVQKTQENWITPTLLNGWTNYPGNWNTASYMKDELGFVHVRGLVQSGAISTNIFVLPVGYRPLKNYIFTTISNNLIGRVDANPDGGIYAWTPSSNVWLPLDMICFRAEQ